MNFQTLALSLAKTTRHGRQFQQQIIKHTRRFLSEQMTSDNPLFQAVDSNDLKQLNDLLKHGMNVNILDDHGESPLHHAANNGNIIVVDMLLQAGAQPDIERNNNHLTSSTSQRHVALDQCIDEVLDKYESIGIPQCNMADYFFNRYGRNKYEQQWWREGKYV